VAVVEVSIETMTEEIDLMVTDPKEAVTNKGTTTEASSRETMTEATVNSNLERTEVVINRGITTESSSPEITTESSSPEVTTIEGSTEGSTMEGNVTSTVRTVLSITTEATTSKNPRTSTSPTCWTTDPETNRPRRETSRRETTISPESSRRETTISPESSRRETMISPESSRRETSISPKETSTSPTFWTMNPAINPGITTVMTGTTSWKTDLREAEVATIEVAMKTETTREVAMATEVTTREVATATETTRETTSETIREAAMATEAAIDKIGINLKIRDLTTTIINVVILNLWIKNPIYWMIWTL
jgi:hypothetical protein